MFDSAVRFEARHVVSDGIRTTVAIESPFWDAIEAIAKEEGIGWKEWTARRLSSRPAQVGRASWLRVAVLPTLSDQVAAVQ